MNMELPVIFTLQQEQKRALARGGGDGACDSDGAGGGGGLSLLHAFSHSLSKTFENFLKKSVYFLFSFKKLWWLRRRWRRTRKRETPVWVSPLSSPTPPYIEREIERGCVCVCVCERERENLYHAYSEK